jgi:hypothetical protein
MVFIALVLIETIFRLRHIEGKLAMWFLDPCLTRKLPLFNGQQIYASVRCPDRCHGDYRDAWGT